LFERERGVEVLAHDGVLEFCSLAEHVDEGFPVLDDEWFFGRGQPSPGGDDTGEGAPPGDDFFPAIKGDAAAVASFASRPGLALIAGGVPLVERGMLFGGVGVAGAMTGAEDRKIAESGARQAKQPAGPPAGRDPLRDSACCKAGLIYREIIALHPLTY
jgi:Haem-degrading